MMRWYGRGLALIGGAVAVSALTAPASPAFAAAEGVVKVGMILSLSGTAANIGQSMQRGADLYQKLHKKDLPAGLDVQFITRDDGSNVATTKRVAQELVVRDHVQMLAGFALTPSGSTVAPIATEAKIPTVIMNATTGSLTRNSPYFVRFSHSNWQMGYVLGVYAAKHGIKNASTLVADYASGLDNEAAFAKGFTDTGGAMLSSVHVPLSTTDYLPYMDRIKAAAPDSLYVFVVAGPGTIATMKAFADADLRANHVQLMGTGDQVPDDELPEVGPAVEGMLNASIYSAFDKRPQNVQFVHDWKAVYGEQSVPDFAAVAAWNGAAAIYQAARELGDKATGDAAMAVLSHYKDPDAPQGAIAIDPATRDIVQTVYLNRVEKVGDHYENVTIESYPDVVDPWKTQNPEK